MNFWSLDNLSNITVNTVLRAKSRSSKRKDLRALPYRARYVNRSRCAPPGSFNSLIHRGWLRPTGNGPGGRSGSSRLGGGHPSVSGAARNNAAIVCSISDQVEIQKLLTAEVPEALAELVGFRQSDVAARWRQRVKGNGFGREGCAWMSYSGSPSPGMRPILS
jgi:hypothetical protein